MEVSGIFVNDCSAKYAISVSECSRNASDVLFSNITMSSFVVRGGAQVDGGGVVISGQCRVVFDGAQFLDNVGRAISAHGESATMIRNALFTNNTKNGNGGCNTHWEGCRPCCRKQHIQQQHRKAEWWSSPHRGEISRIKFQYSI